MSLRRISEIQQLPVLDLETGEMLGEVVSWAIHPLMGKVLAYILGRPNLWKKARVIVPPDIVEYGPKMVIVNRAESVIEPSEVVGLSELVADPIIIIGFQAETESGKVLGHVTDFVFEIVSSTIQQYYVQPSIKLGAWQEDFILPARKLVCIKNHRLIFPDDILAHAKLIVVPQTQTI